MFEPTVVASKEETPSGTTDEDGVTEILFFSFFHDQQQENRSKITCEVELFFQVKFVWYLARGIYYFNLKAATIV